MNRAIGLVCVWALVVATASSAGIPVSPPVLSRGDAAQRVEGAVAGLRPMVAELLGVDSIPAVPVRVASQAEIAEAIIDDSFFSVEGVLPPDLAPDREAIADEIHASMPLLGLVAMYSFSRGEILISPERLAQTLDRARAAGLDPDHAIDQIIAHELVHVVQDDVVGLRQIHRNAFQRCVEENRLEAKFLAGSMIEGHATLVQLQVAEKIGGKPLRNWAVTQLPASGPTHTPMARSYRYGLRFFETIYREGGGAGCWLRVENPPESILEMVTVSGRRGDPIERAFADLSELIGEGDWTTLRRDGVADSLGAGINFIRPSEREIIEQDLASASVVGRMEMPKGRAGTPRAFVVTILAYPSQSEAIASLEGLLALVRVQSARFSIDPDGARRDPVAHELDLPAGKLGYYAGVTPGPGGSQSFGLLAWGGVGRRTVVLHGVGAPGAPGEVEPLLRQVVERILQIDSP